ncbi:hypothetical protein GQ53DRAFT_208404 [Thozetella sp. PMI_491]|nr:hypothetical protein GQ53DRAFT_208404 [Thozetella sp. PMI_491]
MLDCWTRPALTWEVYLGESLRKARLAAYPGTLAACSRLTLAVGPSPPCASGANDSGLRRAMTCRSNARLAAVYKSQGTA